MKRKIVIKVLICCRRSKKSILKAVSKLGGVDDVSLDEEKSTLTVIGDVDPTKVVAKLRRAGKVVVIESVGPHKREERRPDPNPPSLPNVSNHERRHHTTNEEEHPNACVIL